VKVSQILLQDGEMERRNSVSEVKSERDGAEGGRKEGRERKEGKERNRAQHSNTHAEKSALPVAALEVSALSLLCQTAPL